MGGLVFVEIEPDDGMRSKISFGTKITNSEEGDRLVLVNVLIVLISLSPCHCSNCSFTDPNTGCVYDLSSMTIPQGSPDYDAYDSEYDADYWMNICAGVSTNYNYDCDSSAGVCRRHASDRGVSCGEAATIQFIPYQGAHTQYTCEGVTITYGSGEYCDGAGRNRTSIINIGCDSSLPSHPLLSATQVEYTGQGPTCIYHFQLYSYYACATTTSSSATPSPTVSGNQSSGNSAKTTIIIVISVIGACGTVLACVGTCIGIGVKILECKGLLKTKKSETVYILTDSIQE